MRENPLSELMEHKRGDYNNLVDRISALPDEVLVSIMSLLPLKESQATSILSKRWRYVWAFTPFPILNFDAEEALSGFSKLERELKATMYVDWVNSVVERHRGRNIQQFRVRFYRDNMFSTFIDKWIQFAMKEGVQMLELERLRAYTQTKKSGLKRLCPDIASLQPSVYIGFKSLKALDFKGVDVDGEVLNYFLSNCPVLQRLSVSDSSTLGALRVVGQSIPLKYLLIKACNSIQSIEIHDSNLVTFIYSGNEINLLLRNVPLLVEVSIFQYNFDAIHDFLHVAFAQLSCCLSQLRILKLHQKLLYDENHVFPILANLKHLELTFDEDDTLILLHLTSFIKASPSLHKLVLQLKYSTAKSERAFVEAAGYSHHYLKVVETVGYDGRSSDFEIFKYLTETAVKLEKLVINPGVDWPFVSLLDYCYIGEVEREENRQKLKEIMPSTVELIWHL